MDKEKQWSEVNAAGNGYGVGLETQTIAEAVASEGWTIIEENNDTEPFIHCKKIDGTEVMVCDLHGPWACDLRKRK
jgi:hypothetical protein